MQDWGPGRHALTMTSLSLSFSQGAPRLVILSERAARARTKELLFARERRICCLCRHELPHGPPRGADVRKLHLRILPRQQPPLGAALEGGPDCLIHIVRLRLLLGCPCRNVDIDSRPDLEARPRAHYRALRLAQYVVGREALLGDAIEWLLAVLLDAVSKVQDQFGCEVREQRRMDVSNVLREARAAAVVVHHDLQEIRVIGELGVILLRSVER